MITRRSFLKSAIIGTVGISSLSLAMPKNRLPYGYTVLSSLTATESWFFETDPQKAFKDNAARQGVVINLPGIQIHDTLENNLFGPA